MSDVNVKVSGGSTYTEPVKVEIANPVTVVVQISVGRETREWLTRLVVAAVRPGAREEIRRALVEEVVHPTPQDG